MVDNWAVHLAVSLADLTAAMTVVRWAARWVDLTVVYLAALTVASMAVQKAGLLESLLVGY